MTTVTYIRIAAVIIVWIINIQIVMQSNRRISRETRLRVMKFFRGIPENYTGKFAEKRLKIKKWKDKVPQMSDWSKNVYDKSTLSDSSLETLKMYLVEFEKGLYAHLLPPYMVLFPALVAWDNIYLQVFNFICFSLQVMYLTIQRYNFYRFRRVVEYKEKRLNGKKEVS